MEGKIALITGGTGSFGSIFIDKFLENNISEIRIFSRDEKKQEDLRIKNNNEKIKFFIGDVRDYETINNAIKDVNFVFHAAALKQVPSCEFFPMEAYKTNVLGTSNVLDVAIKNNVESVVCLSTDKAVYPINAMGLSKAMMEKVVKAKARDSGNTRISITRYGNVIGSRGSVIPLFLNQIRSNKPLTLTNPKMSRFLMTLEESLDLVMYALNNGNNGDVFIKKSPASTIDQIAKAVMLFSGKVDWPIVNIGKRHGEKDYESLLSIEEMEVAKDMNEYFIVNQDLRDQNYHAFNLKNEQYLESKDYNSRNTNQLNVDEIIELLKKSKMDI